MKITVFGAGKSGIAVSKRLHKEHDIFLTEEKENIDSSTIELLETLKIDFELGGHTQKALEGANLIVLSPGVPLDIPILQKARIWKIPIIGEAELACSFIKKPIIAVTATNGKTTTTALVGKMLKDYGFKAAVAGNIGYPLISVNDSMLDYVVAEISSYQLETIRKFRPKISVILNITEDHLTRHRTMEEYASKKAAIFKNQRGNDCLIYNADDGIVRGILKKALCKKIGFSRIKRIKEGAYIQNSYVCFDKTRICKTSEIRIKGEHNLENSLAAASVAMICGVSANSIRKTLKQFKGVEHRIEFIRRLKGILFYNDSTVSYTHLTLPTKRIV